MTDPYDGTPRVLPGSQAAQAVDEVGQFFAGRTEPVPPADIESFVKHKILEYGGDPITAATAGNTASTLAYQNPANAQMVAENVVGMTVADPALAGSKAKTGILNDLKNAKGELSPADQKDIAFRHANSQLQQAGVTDTQSSAALQSSINAYIDQGVSPDLAAAAALAEILAQSMPQADSFSIFGYLSMLVYGDTNYSFKQIETMDVTNHALHTHLANTTYEMPGHKFSLLCTSSIKTSATGEYVRAHTASAHGFYDGLYISMTPKAASLNLVNFKFGTMSFGLGGLLVSFAPLRIYLAIFDSDLVWANRPIKEEKDRRRTWAQVRTALKKKFTSKQHNVSP